jgi:putative ABC transport system permease protein
MLKRFSDFQDKITHFFLSAMRIFTIAFSNMNRSKTRTALSMIGIVIGVAAIVSMVAIVDGLFQDVQNTIGQVQGLRVLPKNSAGPYSTIDADWAGKIDSISGVRISIPQVIALVTSIDGKSVTFPAVTGIGLDFSRQEKARILGFQGEIIEGRQIRGGERNVVVLGEQVADDYDKFVGSKVKINDLDFRVIGIFSSSSSQGNSAILMSIDDARDISNVSDTKINALIVDIIDPSADEKIARIINFRYGDDLKAYSLSDLSSQFGEILGSLRLLVGAVAAIAAIVAGVGIINTMLMSVIERFKEIGALKAVGWTEGNILSMIMAESALIGITGGLIGLAVGSSIALLINATFGLNVSISIGLLLQAFVFAISISLIAGIYPAYIASKMDPIDALRSE